jgi:integrase
VKLSATRVKALRDPGRYSDGDGLHLFISKTGGKSWVLRITVGGRRRDIGLGGYPAVSLAQARKRASDNREAIGDGRDPVAYKRRPATPAFSEAAHAVHQANKPRWRNERHALAWIQTLQRHAFPEIGDKPIDDIGRADVLKVLTPIWTTRPETARRVRQRMRTIFRWAIANELMEANPAGEGVDGALPPMPKVKAHLRALPYREVEPALKIVDESQASLAAKRCLRFLVLTAARSGEARGAAWDEIDLRSATWTIPASRMKAGMEHRVPLSDQALEVLKLARQLQDGTGLCFPSPLKPGRALSDMTLMKTLRSAGLADRTTVHGFRTSFKNLEHGTD